MTLEQLFYDCQLKSGIGPLDATLLIVVPDFEFKDRRTVFSLLKDMGVEPDIQNGLSNTYITPFYKGAEKSDQEWASLTMEEISFINPKLIWIICTERNQPAKFLGIDMFIQEGYGLYYPFGDRFCILIPDSVCLGSMNKTIKAEMLSRMTRFKSEWPKILESESPYEPLVGRRSDVQAIRRVADEKGYEYDKLLRGPKTYFVMYSVKIGGHVLIVPTELAKRDFEAIHFGIVFSQAELARLDQSGSDIVGEALKVFERRNSDV